jgi:hypothetical protein
MKDAILNNARKWGVGVCLIVWCWVGYAAVAAPAILIFAAFILAGASDAVLRVGGWLSAACFVVFGPIIAYHFGRAFGLRYDKIPTRS